MKKFNFMGAHGNIRFLRGVHEKPIYWVDYLKRSDLHSLHIERGIGEKKELVFMRRKRADTQFKIAAKLTT